MSRITSTDIQTIMQTVKENHAKLNACAGPHNFVCLTPDKPFGAKYRCSLCNGTADGVAVNWYNRGLQHGKKA